MTTTGRTVLGVFNDSAMADQAMTALQTAGFSNQQIHTVGQHASGGFLAGIKNFFTGDDTTADTSASDVTDMGLSDAEATYYEQQSQAGHRVIAVQAPGREQEAAEILRANGASLYGRQQGTTYTTSATTSSNALSATNAAEVTDTTDTSGEQVLRLREEQLNVNKQRVQTGEVGLHKEVVAEQKTVTVPVTHEEAFVERRPVTDAMTDDSTPIGEGETIRVPLSEERVNVRKDTVVTGEVSLGKRAVQETQQVTETVKQEKAHIEQEGDAPIHGTKSDRFHPNSGNDDPLL